MYLQNALKDGLATFVIQELTWMSKSCEEAIKCLKEWYNRPCSVQEEHICSIADAVLVKNGSDKEIRRLYDTAAQHYWVLTAAKNDSFETVLTVILQQKLDKKTQLKWVEFNRDSKNVPLCTELLKFLNLHARLLEGVSHTAHKQVLGSDQKLPVKQPCALPTDVTCPACNKRGHQIHTCTVFKGRILADRTSVVWELGLCMNCLKKGHIAEKCRAPLMCKKCTKHHHTLVQRDPDYLLQKKPEKKEGKEETIVVALSFSKQVLLLTCKVIQKVTTANGYSTVVRALIEIGSSASFAHEWLAQHLCLPHSNKNASVEGVAEASTPTRGSVWFQVSGVEDDEEKVGVEAYVGPLVSGGRSSCGTTFQI